MTAIKWLVIFHRDYENPLEIIEKADELGKVGIPIKIEISENEHGERMINLSVPQKRFQESAQKIFGWAL